MHTYGSLLVKEAAGELVAERRMGIEGSLMTLTTISSRPRRWLAKYLNPYTGGGGSIIMLLTVII